MQYLCPEVKQLDASRAQCPVRFKGAELWGQCDVKSTVCVCGPGQAGNWVTWGRTSTSELFLSHAWLTTVTLFLLSTVLLISYRLHSFLSDSPPSYTLFESFKNSLTLEYQKGSVLCDLPCDVWLKRYFGVCWQEKQLQCYLQVIVQYNKRLTFLLCKCVEQVVCDLLTSSIADKMDPFQFAYRAKCGVEDACLKLLDTVITNLDHPHS